MGVGLQLLREEERKEIRGFYLLGSYPLVGRHVANESKVEYHVVNKAKVASMTLSVMLQMSFEYLKSDVRWIIRLRLYSGPEGCGVPG